jgi:hypothetical protein
LSCKPICSDVHLSQREECVGAPGVKRMYRAPENAFFGDHDHRFDTRQVSHSSLCFAAFLRRRSDFSFLAFMFLGEKLICLHLPPGSDDILWSRAPSDCLDAETAASHDDSSTCYGSHPRQLQFKSYRSSREHRGELYFDGSMSDCGGIETVISTRLSPLAPMGGGH